MSWRSSLMTRPINFGVEVIQPLINVDIFHCRNQRLCCMLPHSEGCACQTKHIPFLTRGHHGS